MYHWRCSVEYLGTIINAGQCISIAENPASYCALMKCFVPEEGQTIVIFPQIQKHCLKMKYSYEELCLLLARAQSSLFETFAMFVIMLQMWSPTREALIHTTGIKQDH